jgi:hypothetical protein
MSAEPRNGIQTYRQNGPKVTFGFAARMEELKGSGVLIDAFAELHRNATMFD